MNTGIYFLSSKLRENDVIEQEKQSLLTEFSKAFNSVEVTPEQLNECDFLFICVLSGGTEGMFVDFHKYIEQASKPFVIIATEKNNSLPAAVEILTWLREVKKSDKAAILTGDLDSIIKDASLRLKVAESFINMRSKKIAVIGDPEPWLVASRLDLSIIEKKLGISYQRLKTDYFCELYNKTQPDEEFLEHFKPIFSQTSHDIKELNNAAKTYAALKEICNELKLDAFSFSCFNFLSSNSVTACLPLALFNEKGIAASCEGDVPALVSMVIAKELTGIVPFMANPAKIRDSEIIFAHCTAPCNLINNPTITTHFESNKSLALSGCFSEDKITLFKAGSTFLTKYVVSEGYSIAHEQDDNLCRLQMRTKLDASNYFLNNPLGNHHLIIPGWHKSCIDMFCKRAGMTSVALS